MSKKLERNGLWESSRMMLPEHREQLLEFHRKDKEHSRPELDEQRLEQLAQTIAEAIEHDLEIRLHLFDAVSGETILTGRVTKMDPQLQRLKLESGDDIRWVPWKDIVGAE